MRKIWIWVQLLFKDFATTQLCRIKKYDNPIHGFDPQGMDIYKNRYIFQGNDFKSKQTIVIFDLQKKKIIGEIFLKINECHMNNINLGPVIGKWPLLYVSECMGNHQCYVIKLDDDLKECSIIQTIKFTSDKHYQKGTYPFDWFLGAGYIYTYGMTETENEIEVLKFPIPSYAKINVNYTDKYILDSFKIQDCYIYQGTKIINNKLYTVNGIDPCKLRIINLDLHQVEKEYTLEGFGELEAVAPYEDGIAVVNCSINPVYTFIKLK